MTIEKLAAGIWRVTDGSGAFGHIRKVGRKWEAEIRNSATGDMIRPAGIWNTQTEAAEECAYQVPRNQPWH